MTVMNENLTNDAVIKKDRLRFTKNKLSANLALLGIVFDALYFVSIYKSDVGSYYYNWLIGVSVLYNLVFMLAAFLASEGVKNYKKAFSFLLMLLGAGQIVRIFILPMSAKAATITLGEEIIPVMEDGQFIYVCACLVLSAACCVISGIIAFIKTTTLETYTAELEKRAAEGK